MSCPPGQVCKIPLDQRGVLTNASEDALQKTIELSWPPVRGLATVVEKAPVGADALQSSGLSETLSASFCWKVAHMSKADASRSPRLQSRECGSQSVKAQLHA